MSQSARVKPVQAFDSVTAYLSWDHDRLDAILSDTTVMVDDGELERAEHTFHDFHDGLRRHIRLEEELLFPAFERATGIVGGPTAVMRAEHVEILKALAQMVDALDRGDPASFHDGHRMMGNVMGSHNIKEEHILYPGTDNALTAEQRRALVEQLVRS